MRKPTLTQLTKDTQPITQEVFSSNVWLLGGNTLIGTPFLGSLNNVLVEVRVNNHRAVRYGYVENTVTAGSEYRSINVLGGSELNSIFAGVTGATISGGGKDNFTGTDAPNMVAEDFGTIGGGGGNTAGGLFSTV